MTRLLMAIIGAAALMAGAAQAGPTAGRTLVLDVAQQDNLWSNISTRGEAYYLKVELRNRSLSYTNNDLTGYLWYATNSLSAAGVKINLYSKETGAVYFYLSATNTLGLSTNAESYFAQIILTNATGTVVYDWKQGKFVTRHGSGLTGAGVAPSTTLINWDTITNTGTIPWSGSGISGATASQIVHNVTDSGFAAATNYTDTATNGLRVWVQSQGYSTGGGGAVTSVFGRAGVVTAQSGDYTAQQVGALTALQTTQLVEDAVAPVTNRVTVLESGTSRWESAYINSTNWLTSAAYAITANDTNNWTTAYGWGNHAGAGYLTPSATQALVTSAQTTNIINEWAFLGSVYHASTAEEADAANYAGEAGNAQTLQDLPLASFVQTNNPALTNDRAPTAHAQDWSTLTGAPPKLAASTNADYAASAGTAANATNLNGLAASSYVTNGGATVNGSPITNGAAIMVSGGGADAASTNWFQNGQNLTNLTSVFVGNGDASTSTIASTSTLYPVSVSTMTSGSVGWSVSNGAAYCSSPGTFMAFWTLYHSGATISDTYDAYIQFESNGFSTTNRVRIFYGNLSAISKGNEVVLAGMAGPFVAATNCGVRGAVLSYNGTGTKVWISSIRVLRLPR